MKKGSIFLSEDEYKKKLFSLYTHGFDYKKFSKEWDEARTELKKCNSKSDKMVRTISGIRFKGGDEC